MSDKSNALTDMVFRIFGGLYTDVIKELERSAPDKIYAVFVVLISAARKRSGLSPEKSLRLIVSLRDVLTHIIDKEK